MDGRDVYAAPPPPPERDAAGVSRRALLRLGPSRFSRAAVDIDAVTRRVREDWERGGREPLLRAIAPAAEVVAAEAGIVPGMRVLDVGAGDGNVAAACLAAGARVDACDLAAAMVARGRARVPGADWVRADAAALPYEDAAFDAVVSAFGVAPAPRVGRVLGELARVCRPGGRIVLAAWVPRGLPGRLTAFCDAVAPLPEGVRSPAAWGQADLARLRLERVCVDVAARTRTVPLVFASADALFAQLVPSAFDAEQRARLRDAFDRLLAASNNRPGDAVVDARYLVVSGRRDPRGPARAAPRSRAAARAGG